MVASSDYEIHNNTHTHMSLVVFLMPALVITACELIVHGAEIKGEV